jgi:hypothetical protein
VRDLKWARLGKDILPGRLARRLQDVGKFNSEGSAPSCSADHQSSKNLPPLEERIMDNFSFTLQVSGIDTERDDYEDTFYGKNCDDALIRVVNQTLFLDFDREADSYESAVASAIRDVEQAGGKVVKADPIFD